MSKLDFDKVVKVTIDQLMQDGFIAQKIIFDGGGMILAYQDDKEKEYALKAARKIVTDLNLDRYWHISECWFTKVDKGDMPFIRPSHRVDRQEGLIISEFNRNMVIRCVVIMFDRTKDKNGKDNITIGETNILPTTDSTSIWNFYLEKEGVDEKIDNLQKEANDRFLKNEVDLFMKEFPRDQIKSMSKEEFAEKATKYIIDRRKRVESVIDTKINKDGGK